MKKFAIIDIETTGGIASRDRITEIAIVTHDGERALEQYATLINPERSIPYHITNITGITDEMVADAPKFYEVAKQIVQMTEGCIFVAHNVKFDYSFVKEEFARLGFTYTRKQLCTVRLARQAMPGFRSYALGNLIKELNIKVNDRHRALDDTLATVEVFEKIIAIENGTSSMVERVNQGIKESQLPKGITIEKLHALPEQCGVYYLHNEKGDVIYVGKSINIKKRIMDHFADKTQKGQKIYEGVADISFEITGSELISLLFENQEIKRISPRINKAQRAKNSPYVIYSYTDEQNFIRFGAAKNTAALRKKMNVLSEFTQLSYAKNTLKSLAKKYELCHKLIGLETQEGPCFLHHLDQCHGACCGEEMTFTYNERAAEAVNSMKTVFPNDFLLIDKGRNANEKSVVLIENNRYKGFGFFDANDSFSSPYELKDYIKSAPSNADAIKIIRYFLSENKGVKKIDLV
jgi:DNA polymerase III subunit epsilon